MWRYLVSKIELNFENFIKLTIFYNIAAKYVSIKIDIGTNVLPSASSKCTPWIIKCSSGFVKKIILVMIFRFCCKSQVQYRLTYWDKNYQYQEEFTAKDLYLLNILLYIYT